jgi:hypothetical protein
MTTNATIPAAAKSSAKSRSSGDPTANIPVPAVDTSGVEAPAAEVVTPAPEVTSEQAEIDAALGLGDAIAAAETAEAPAEVDPDKAKEPESAALRSIRKREAKLQKEKEALRVEKAETARAVETVTREREEARQYATQLRDREVTFVATLKKDPIAVLERFGWSKHDLAQALLGRAKAPQDDAARQEVETLKADLRALREGLTTRETMTAQQQAESQALDLVAKDPAYKHLGRLAKSAPGYVVAELNAAAATLLRAGKRLPLADIVAAVERKHARLAKELGTEALPAASTNTAGKPAFPAGRPGAKAEPTPTLSSRTAGERAPARLDPLKDQKAVDRAAIAAADAARKPRTPK